MPHILIVEDEPAIADTLTYALRAEGFACTWLGTAGEALASLRERPADLVILDIGLPDLSGFEACRQLRSFSDVPVLFLTARNDELDRVLGLELGADDYVTKPFSPREVCARVRAILRRLAPRSEPAASGPFQVEPERARIRFHGQPLALTRLEYRLLEHLLSQPGRVFSREQLLDAGGAASGAGYERNIDSHIKSLRGKLRAAGPGEPIQTHRGLGYSYDPEHS